MDQLAHPPPAIAAELDSLRVALNRAIPPKLLDRNLLIATWNLRRLGEVTEKWQSEPGDVPPRDLHSLACIAKILAHFDVIALQEIIDRGRALRLVLDHLGPNWGLLLTDPSPGRLGNRERMAFLYDRRKVLPSGVVCELVIPQERLERAAQAAGQPPRRGARRASPPEAAGQAALDRQFARTPYAAGFRTLEKSYTLLNLHIIWGESPLEREQELREIAHWIADWAKHDTTWDSNLIAVGDFNIDTVESPLYRAFTSTGLQVPDDLLQAPRHLFQRPDAPIKLYDQIAWFAGAGEVPPLGMRYISGGSFDFRPHVLRDRQVDLRRLSYMISDHFPLWAEFSVRD